jgi:hypothetical protein
VLLFVCNNVMVANRRLCAVARLRLVLLAMHTLVLGHHMHVHFNQTLDNKRNMVVSHLRVDHDARNARQRRNRAIGDAQRAGERIVEQRQVETTAGNETARRRLDVALALLDWQLSCIDF